jgi:FAD/FMN-containing dehydrogenase
MAAESANGNARSWGLPGPFRHRVLAPASVDEIQLPADDVWLPRATGRSYGDVALNEGHTLVDTRWLDRYVSFDPQSGILECEGGMLLSTIIDDLLPRGWFLPVVPGTRHVSVGGAIANDVHGKNHHAAGSFGDHVEGITLVRTDGNQIDATRSHNADWLAATIGGLGLTGLITRARLRLRRVGTGWMKVTARRFQGLETFFALNAEAERSSEYTVSWVDCLSGAERLRGVLLAGDHVDEVPADRPRAAFPAAPKRVTWPLTPPVSLVNALSLRAFNSAYFHKAPREATFLQPVWDYFWPLDKIEHWNRIYGPRGLLQYQFVVPPEHARATITRVLEMLRSSGSGSFLAVLKTFGNRQAPGMLSFARPGLTLALDFPNVPKVHALFIQLDECIRAAGGALYPAKDARGSSALFHGAYPRWAEFQQYRDLGVSSGFLRRMEMK